VVSILPEAFVFLRHCAFFFFWCECEPFPLISLDCDRGLSAQQKEGKRLVFSLSLMGLRSVADLAA